MFNRVFPHPLLTVLLTVTWLMLVNRFSWNSLIFGFFLGCRWRHLHPAGAARDVERPALPAGGHEQDGEQGCQESSHCIEPLRKGHLV